MKKKSTEIFALIFGSLIMFTSILPLVDSISTFVQSKFNYHTNKLQNKMQKELNEEEQDVRAIGFNYEDEEYEEN